MGEYTTMHQYEPLRVPEGWSASEKRLIAQLTEIFDDLYRRFNRLRFEDLGGALRGRIEDTEGNVTQVAQTATELEALLNGTRFTLTAAGVTIRNAAGQVVFEQDANTGNLRIAGQIAATGGTIGGFTIGSTSLYNGTSIVLSSEGQVRLGDLSVEDDAELGPIVRGDGGLRLCVGNSALLVLSESGASTGFPLSAYGGLSINPNDVTNLAANVYVDPATGRLYRTTSTGGGTVTEPLTATAGVSATTVTVGESVTVSVEASGGTAPYVCSLTVSYNDGSFVSLGTGMSVSYTPQSAGAVPVPCGGGGRGWKLGDGVHAVLHGGGCGGGAQHHGMGEQDERADGGDGDVLLERDGRAVVLRIHAQAAERNGCHGDDRDADDVVLYADADGDVPVCGVCEIRGRGRRGGHGGGDGDGRGERGSDDGDEREHAVGAGDGLQHRADDSGERDAGDNHGSADGRLVAGAV